MTILDRYLGLRLISTTAKVLFSLVALVLVIDLLTHRQGQIADYQIPIPVVAEYYLTFIPTILFEFQAVALAMLVGAFMVLGKAAQDKEILAALAGGISMRRVSASLLAVGALVAIAMWAVQETWAVSATRRMAQIEQEFFTQFSGTARQGVSWAHLEGGWTAHVLKFNRAAMSGEDVFLHRITENTMDEIRARRIYWEPSEKVWLLEDGRKFSFDFDRAWEQRAARITQEAAPFPESPEDLFVLHEPAATKSAGELRQDLQRAEDLGLPVTRHWVDYYVKTARPALAFVMVLLAVPFAIYVRRGGIAVGFGMSLAIGLAYMIVFYACIGLGWLGIIAPLAAAWTANILFFIAGTVLFLRTPT